MFRWVISGFFLSLPVGTTIGVLMGLQALNRATGKPPPMWSNDRTGGLPGIGVIEPDAVKISCDTAEGVYSKALDGLDFSCMFCLEWPPRIDRAFPEQQSKLCALKQRRREGEEKNEQEQKKQKNRKRRGKKKRKRRRSKRENHKQTHKHTHAHRREQHQKKKHDMLDLSMLTSPLQCRQILGVGKRATLDTFA